MPIFFEIGKDYNSFKLCLHPWWWNIVVETEAEYQKWLAEQKTIAELL